MCEGEDDCTIWSSYVFQAVSSTNFLAGVLSTDLIQILSNNLLRQRSSFVVNLLTDCKNPTSTEQTDLDHGSL